jgi:hypothetical protein
MRIAATILLPTGSAREEAKALAWFPGLTDMNAQGSINQYLRYLNARQFHLTFRIDEHDIGGPPAPTFRWRLDFNADLDVGYEVQSRLWDIGFRRATGTVAILADDLKAHIESRLHRARSTASDIDVMESLRLVEQRMGGIAIIPKVGRPTAILDRLGDHACDLFRDAAGAIDISYSI